MFRVSRMLRQIDHPTPAGPRSDPPAPVVVWNLIRRCNLACRHCYSISADKDFPGELTTGEVFTVLDDLARFGVPWLILSGGEPLLRPDIFEVSRRAREMGFRVGLSTNGTLIGPATIDAVAEAGYDYVGISIDGLEATHDAFRGRRGAFAEAMAGVGLCTARGLEVGLRFTMTRDNADQLPAMLDLAEGVGAGRFYLSHLNYAGRGNRNRGDDAYFAATRRAMDLVFERSLEYLRQGRELEVATGNNDADGVYLLHWARERFPERADHLRAKLVQWGGNASGVNVANIDNLGDVHPDTMWWHATLGNVRTQPFSEIWSDPSEPLLAGLRRRPRPVTGRCAACRHLDICNGNTRIRAERLSGDVWAEDPGCYLDDHEIGLPADTRSQP